MLCVGQCAHNDASISKHVLSLYDNRIGDKGAIAIVTPLRTNTKLTQLEYVIDDRHCNTAGWHLPTVLTVIFWYFSSLSGNQIGDLGARAIAEMLKVNNTLIHIRYVREYSNSHVRQRRPSFLNKRPLPFPFPPYRISLQGNNISDDGAKRISEALQTNKTITSIQ